MTKLIPSPDIMAYTISDKDAPNPDMNPCNRPSFRVRCMHRTPMGPMGAETNSPMNIPLSIVSSILISRIKYYSVEQR